LFVILTNVFVLAGPWVLKLTIDSLKGAMAVSRLTRFAALLVLLALLEGIFRFLMRKVLIGVSRKVEYDLRNEYFAHLQSMSQSFFSRFKTGDLMARATNDLEAVRQVVGPAIMYSFNTLVSLAAFVVMIQINLQLTLLAMIPFPIMAFVINRIARRLNRTYAEIQSKYADITSRVQENISGIRVVKAYVQEDGEIRNFRKLNAEYIERNMRMAKLRGAMTASMTVLVGVGTLIVLWFGGKLVIHDAITLGEFVAFFAYLGRLTWPMIALGWVINLLQQGAASMGRINRILKQQPDIRDTAATDHAIKELQGRIEFRDVSFVYEGQRVLHGINLTIEKGKTLAIVGHTGSGKSTLINLIPRLLEATDGHVFIDGHDIRTIPLDVLRRHIGYVPQDTFLFSDTIKANIGFGVATTSEHAIEEAAEISQIRKDVVDFPHGFDTVLGERGVNISGGQKQRTAIARAVIRKPRILILDDSLSAVDTYTEEAILNQLRTVMRERTSIIVSHRISAVKHADVIIVLENGRIEEQGTHAELVELNGLYNELYQQQLLEEALEEI